RCEIEMRLLAMIPQDPIRGLVDAVRHLLSRQVGQLGQNLLDLRPQPGGLGSRLGLGFPVLQALAQQWRSVFAALLGGSDFARDAITSGLGLLRSRLGGAPVAVEHEYLGRPRRQTPPGQATVQFLRVVPDPSEIVHCAIGYKGPAAPRPSAGNVSRRRRA